MPRKSSPAPSSTGCPLKHARHVLGSHVRYAGFADFGDAEAYRKELAILRKRLAEEEP